MALSSCSPASLPYPVIPGVEFTSLAAHPVQNASWGLIQGAVSHRNHGDTNADGLSFCNVTLTHTHPGLNDSTTTQVWLPLRPQWNGRLQALGGGGWQAGLGPEEDATMAAAVAQGYVTVMTDGSLPGVGEPKDWALLAPGVVDVQRLINFASRSLADGALASKALAHSFYGRAVEKSYWSGCSTGGRQGYAFAQRYPDIFDGIAAAAPAINWHKFFFAVLSVQVKMNAAGEFTRPCELNALTRAAIAACDGLDGLEDGVVSAPDECTFDPYSLVGTSVEDCEVPISELAAKTAEQAWEGFKSQEGELLWPTVGYEANLTTPSGTASTICPPDGGPCEGFMRPLLTDWPTYFIAKNASFNWRSLSEAEFEKMFRVGKASFEAAIMATDNTDLKLFKERGGKLLTYHGLVSVFLFSSHTAPCFDGKRDRC